MKIIIDGIIESLKTRMDNSIVVTFSTNEMDSSNAASLFQLRGKYCKALFSDTNITPLENELIDNTKIVAIQKNKTPSQRLRAVLWRIYEQSGLQIKFEDYYNTEMEKIITHYKTKLG